jgi:hypothetical protein
MDSTMDTRVVVRYSCMHEVSALRAPPCELQLVSEIYYTLQKLTMENACQIRWIPCSVYKLVDCVLDTEGSI